MMDIELPGLVWVKDPIDLRTRAPNGAPPRHRHHEDCPHFERDVDGSMIGPPPYRASEQQMHTLPPCQTCASSTTGSGGSHHAIGTVHGEICPTCCMEMPLVGGCPNCS